MHSAWTSGKRLIALDYGTVLANTDTHVFLHRTLPLIEQVEALAGYRTGVLVGDYVESYLKARLPGGAVVPYSDYEAILEDLRAGKLKACAADTPTGIYHLKRQDLLQDFKISGNHLHYSIRKQPNHLRAVGPPPSPATNR